MCKPRPKPLTEGNTMHNPAPPPRQRPPAPPAPPRPGSTQELKHVSRLRIPETGGSPDVYIVKLSQRVPNSVIDTIRIELAPKIEKLAPGSELAILPHCVEAVEVVKKPVTDEDDSWINERIGKKKTVSFPKWLGMISAPTNGRFILARNAYKEYSVVRYKIRDEFPAWEDADTVIHTPVEWMELPE